MVNLSQAHTDRCLPPVNTGAAMPGTLASSSFGTGEDGPSLPPLHASISGPPLVAFGAMSRLAEDENVATAATGEIAMGGALRKGGKKKQAPRRLKKE